ncbi:hypothetical protein BJ742DRAFT_784989 [Cladochytrium replicatum]|nr:hypothetical protein BJ742DRAFT_784989 [Cladochytrium replicatum]
MFSSVQSSLSLWTTLTPLTHAQWLFRSSNSPATTKPPWNTVPPPWRADGSGLSVRGRGKLNHDIVCGQYDTVSWDPRGVEVLREILRLLSESDEKLCGQIGIACEGIWMHCVKRSERSSQTTGILLWYCSRGTFWEHVFRPTLSGM